MNNKVILTVLAVVVVVSTGVWVWQQSAIPASVVSDDGSAPKVAATLFPIYDIARQVAGDRIEVVGILPPGVSPHTFNPRPSDLAKLQGSRLVFAVGHGLDDWTGSLLNNLDDATVVTVDQGIALREFVGGHEHQHTADDHDDDEHEGLDPHYWLSVKNARQIAASIASALSVLYPDSADYFAANLSQYQAELAHLEVDLTDRLAPAAGQGIILFHDSWGYFAADYDLDIVGIFQPAPGKEPTPQYLKELYAAAADHNVDTVFTEPQLGSAAVDPLIEDLGLAVAVLDPLGGVAGRDSYVDLMRYNANTIVQSLQAE